MGNCKYRGTFPRLKFTVISIRFAIRIIYAKRSAYHIAYLSSLLPKTWIDTESKKKKKKTFHFHSTGRKRVSNGGPHYRHREDISGKLEATPVC